MASGEENITAANVEEFRPAEETIKQTINRLRELGFAVSPGGITLTISGEPALFEKVFNVKIIKEKQYGDGIIIRTDRQISIPASLSHHVEKVEFMPPPIFFDRKK
jgi:subtilase family serine protease